MRLGRNCILAANGHTLVGRAFRRISLSRAATVALLILDLLHCAAFGQTPQGKIIAPVRVAETSASSRLAASYGKLPLSFEANQGQTDPQVRFLSRGYGYSLFLTEGEAVLALHKPVNPDPASSESRLPGHTALSGERSVNGDVVRTQLAGARSDAHVTGESKLSGVASYMIGNDPRKWHSAVPTYAKVKYAGVYPGVDLVYYGNQQQLEYDFVVAPGASTDSIRLHFAGAKRLRLGSNGELEIIAGNGQIAFHKPVVYQETNRKRIAIDGRFALTANNTVSFRLGRYDHLKELVIDPTLAYSTYLGGTNGANYGTAIAVDAGGNAYVTGIVYATNFPATSGAFQSTNHASTAGAIFNEFVSKLNAAGTALVYSTYLGGSGNTAIAGTLNHGDYPESISVNASGEVYLTGSAISTDFPTTSGVVQSVNKGGPHGVSNCFVTKINATGTGLVYSTYLGGTGLPGYTGQASLNSNGGDGCGSIVMDGAGNAYVVGTSWSSDFPVTSGSYQGTNKSASVSRPAAFAAKLNPQATALSYATYLGGSNGDSAMGAALDASGDLYIAGATESNDFPVTSGVYQSTNKAFNNGFSNAFAAKLNPTGSGLVYSTYLGGSGNPNGPQNNNNGDGAFSIAIDSSDNAYLFGLSASADFPITSGAYQSTNKVFSSSGGPTFFVSKLNASASSLTYSTYVGGSGIDAIAGPAGMAVDSSGDVYFTGYAESNDFPVTGDAYQATPTCALASVGATAEYLSPIVTELNPTGTGLVYSTYFGGSGLVTATVPVTIEDCDMGYGLALDASNNIYLTGNASSPNFPITTGAYQTTNHATINAYVAKFSAGASPTTFPTATSVSASANPAVAGQDVTFTADVTAESGSGTPTGTVSFSVDGGAGIQETLNSSGEASYPSSTLTVGTHTITASYSAGANYSASVSNTLTETITASSSQTAATPTFSPAGGAYSSAQTVTITDATTGAAIFYTLDGTTPTTNSTPYGTPISVPSSETIEAIAVASGYTNSGVGTAIYTINLAPPSFTISASPATAAVDSGKSATFTLTVTPENGFTQAVSFSCSGLPSGDECTFSPPTVTPSGAATSTTLSIAASTSAESQKRRPWEHVGEGMALALLFWPFCRRRGRTFCVVAFLSLTVLLATGCGSGQKAQSYSVTVTASGGSVTQTTSLSLTVTR